MGIRKYIPVIGVKYGQWTVISTEIKNSGSKNNRNSYFKVKCQCGREGWRNSYTLVNGTTKSCKSCCKTANNQNTFVTSYYNKVEKRAEKIKVEFDLSIDFLEKLIVKQKYICALSGIPIEFKPNYKKNRQTASLDRIDNKKGYTKENVQWVHKQINFMKGTMSQNTFIEMCKKVTSKCG